MNADELAKAVKDAIAENRRKPPRERFQALIDRGAIDEMGKVLIRTPGPDTAIGGSNT